MNHILRHLKLHIRGEYSTVIYLTDNPTLPWFISIWEVFLAPVSYYCGSNLLVPSIGSILPRQSITIYEEPPVVSKPFGGTKPKNPFSKAQPWKDR